jgi:hypothetical protein
VAEAVGALRVDLSANSAQFDADMRRARSSLDGFGGSMHKIGAIGGEAGERLARGLKRGVGDLAELGDKAGFAGREISRIGGSIADVLLGGFNPLSLAIAGAGFLVGTLASKSDETFKRKVPEAVKVSTEALDSAVDKLRDLNRELSRVHDATPRDILQLEDQIARQRAINEAQFAGHVRPTDRETFTLSVLEAQLAALQKIHRQRESDKLLEDIGERGRKSDVDAARADAAERERLAQENKRRNDRLAQEAIDQLNLDFELAQKREDEETRRRRRHAEAELEIREDLEQLEVDKRKDQAALQDALLDLQAEGETSRLRLVEISTERELAAVDDRYRKLLEDLRLHGEDETQLVQAIEVAKGRIRAQGAREVDALVLSRSAAEEVSAFARVGEDAFQDLKAANAELWVDVSHGARNAGQIVLRVLDQVEARFIQLAANQAFDALFAAVRPSGAGGLTASKVNAAFPNDPAVTEGVAYTRSALRIEHHVHDEVGVRTEQSVTQTPDGAVIDTFIRRAVVNDLARGGEISRTLEDSFGVSRKGRRRGV